MAVPLASLLTDIRNLSGLKSNQFYTDVDLAVMASDQWKDLYDRFVEANQHYRIKTFSFTLTGGQGGNTVTLPADFQLGNGLELNPTFPRPWSVNYLSSWLNRNNLGATVLNNSFVCPDGRQYCFNDNQLIVYPADISAGDYKLYYTPMADTLLARQEYDFNLPNDVSVTVPDPMRFTFSNGAFTSDMIGGTMTLNFTGGTGAANAWANGIYTITDVLSATTIDTNGSAGSNVLSYPTAGTAQVSFQPPRTVNALPDYADAWALYIKIGTSIAIREARQQDVSDLSRRFQEQEARVDKALENRQEEATQPPLTRDRGFWDSL